MDLFYFLHRVVMNINESECEKYFACCKILLVVLAISINKKSNNNIAI